MLLRILFYGLPLLLAALTYNGVSFKTDLSTFIVSGKNADEALLAHAMQSGNLSRRYLIAITSNTNQAVEPQFIQQLIAQLKRIDKVTDVWNPEQKKQALNALQTLYVNHANSIYSLHPEDDLNTLFSTQGLHQKAHFLKQALLSPQASLIKPIALQDPLLLTLNGFQGLAKKFKAQPTTSYQNLILETRPSGMDTAAQKAIQQAILARFKALNANQNYQLEMTGVPVFAVTTQGLIQGDIIKISVVSSLALMLLFLWAFRSLFQMFQVFTLLAIVILSAILITASIFGYIHGMTIAIGATLVGICIDYPIHALVHAQQSSQQPPRSIIVQIWPSMLLGGVTTMIGYLALGVSGYPGFQQVAVFAASGIVIALLITRFMLPALVIQSAQPVRIVGIQSWIHLCQRYRKIGWTMIAVFLMVAIWPLSHLQWMQDMQQLTPELDDLKQQDRRIRARMTSIEPGRFILVSGDTTELALRHAEQVYKRLDQLKQQQALSEYFGLFPWLLSSQQQRLNQKTLKAKLTPTNIKHWQDALQQEGLSVTKLGHLNYPSNPPLTLDVIFKTPVKHLLDSRIMQQADKTIILIGLSQHTPEIVRQAFSDWSHARYFSQRDLLNAMLNDYTQMAKKLLLAGVGLIMLLMLHRYRSLTMTVSTLLPALLAALFILSSWAIAGVAISFLHLVAFLLVVAICVDYGIFYQENRGGNILVTYQAMTVSMLTSALAFGSLLAAESTSLKILAGVVSLGVLIGFMLCPLIIQQAENIDKLKN